MESIEVTQMATKSVRPDVVISKIERFEGLTEGEKDYAVKALKLQIPMAPSLNKFDDITGKTCYDYRCGRCKMGIAKYSPYCSCGQLQTWMGV